MLAESNATWSNFSSNFATFASQATASIKSAVETAEAQVLRSNSQSSPRSSIVTGGTTSAANLAPADSTGTNMSYQERQRLLHQQYQAANPAGASIASQSSQTSLPKYAVQSNTLSTKATPSSNNMDTPQQPTNVFLEKLTSNLDTVMKTKLIASALGDLLPGERIIMFLNSLKDVKDSRFPMMMVGSPNVMSAGLKDILGYYDEDDFEDDDEESVATVWCCVMTFYRVVVFSYRANVANGTILFNDDGIESTSDQEGTSSTDRIRGDKKRVQHWVDSQNVSVQFQAAHDQEEQLKKQYHHVFEMPLASIERVEKTMASSQLSGAGVTTSSPSSYSNYQGILPSSSAVSSASSAMSQLGSQMKPLLGSINANSNMLSNAPINSSSNNINATITSYGPLGIILHGKDGGRWIKFSTNSYSDAMRAHEALSTYAFPGRLNLGYLFAFESRRNEVMASAQKQSEGGQSAPAVPPTPRRFVPMEEFERQGIFSPRMNGYDEMASPWAPITANSNYGLCSSYPSVLIGPRSIVGDGASESGISLLRRCAAFRSENRFPALTFGSKHHGGSIWRSSQPKVGLQGNRSIDDESYLHAIGEEAKRANLAADTRAEGGVGSGTGRPPNEFLRMLCGRNNESDLILEGVSSSCMLKIMDMRPKSAAMANRTQGYGYENTNYYRGTTLNFYGIGNIHAVRDAYQKVNALCISPNASDIQWMQLVENTNWTSMTRLILSASWQTAFHVHYNRLPVLLHCSHGWDRTSQVSALAQLMLDPYYRTIKGFSTLVEKDFMSFGHPLHTRCGHGEGKNEQGGDEGQLAPIFLQFLDCVFQLVHQWPDYFEFNTRYLLLLSEHIYSCRFGTFLCDSEREREVVAGTRQRTYCLWEYLDSIPKLVNHTFNKTASEDSCVLIMPLPMLLRNVTLWTDRLCMYGAKAAIPSIPRNLLSCHHKEVQSQDKEPVILHSVVDVDVRTLNKAIEEANEWKSKALAALKEIEELKKKDT